MANWKELFKKVTDGAQQGVQKAGELASKGAQTATEAWDKTVDGTADIRAKASELASKGVKQATDLADTATTAVSGAVNAVKAKNEAQKSDPAP